MSKVYLVTGANSGLGLDAVRQLALKEDTKLVYMACRTEEKANKAMHGLVKTHSVPKAKLAFVTFDGSVSKDVYQQQMKVIQEPLDGVIFNAGGFGQGKGEKMKQPVEPNQVLEIVQINLMGHVHFLDAMEAAKKLKKGTRIVFSGSEGSRGIQFMAKAPVMPTTSDEFLGYLDGTAYKKFDSMEAYTITKGIATLYFAAWAREHPDQVVLTVSPGGTKGTDISGQGAIGWMEKLAMGTFSPVLAFVGMMHSVEVGAKRYVDAVTAAEDYKEFPSGCFVASARAGTTGPVADQTKLFGASGEQYGDKQRQDAVYQAMKKFR